MITTMFLIRQAWRRTGGGFWCHTESSDIMYSMFPWTCLELDSKKLNFLPATASGDCRWWRPDSARSWGKTGFCIMHLFNLKCLCSPLEAGIFMCSNILLVWGPRVNSFLKEKKTLVSMAPLMLPWLAKEFVNSTEDFSLFLSLPSPSQLYLLSTTCSVALLATSLVGWPWKSSSAQSTLGISFQVPSWDYLLRPVMLLSCRGRPWSCVSTFLRGIGLIINACSSV